MRCHSNMACIRCHANNRNDTRSEGFSDPDVPILLPGLRSCDRGVNPSKSLPYTMDVLERMLAPRCRAQRRSMVQLRDRGPKHTASVPSGIEYRGLARRTVAVAKLFFGREIFFNLKFPASLFWITLEHLVHLHHPCERIHTVVAVCRSAAAGGYAPECGRAVCRAV